ncbi:hypothetical protein J132_01584 [Termitomyces sp. J132]|nr:hypothetical protein J132_01584 [Termitomyces sp. J132]
MSPKTVPTAPRKMPPPKVGRPQVVITTSPRPTPVRRHTPSPPDFYGMLQHAVKRDAHQVILAVLQRPLFAQAVIGLCNTAAAFSSTPADRARYLGSIGWNFTDQADFPLLADQKGLYNALSATLDVLDRDAAADSAAVNSFFIFADAIIKTEDNRRELQRQREAAAKQRRKREDRDIEMLASHLDLLAHRFDTLNLFLSSPQSELDGKPKPKKVKITPSVANYKLGGETALYLLGQVDALLEAHPVIDGHNLAPLKDLKKQRNAVELAAEQQLHLLDTTLQTYKLIVARLSHLDKALSPIDVDLAGSLLTALNVSFESVPEDSDVEPANPLAAEPQDPVELPSTPTL